MNINILSLRWYRSFWIHNWFYSSNNFDYTT